MIFGKLNHNCQKRIFVLFLIPGKHSESSHRHTRFYDGKQLFSRKPRASGNYAIDIL